MIAKYLLLPLIVIVMVVGLATTASAATQTWDGNGDTTTWSDALNWNTTTPASGDDIVINTSCYGWPIGTKTLVNDIENLNLAGMQLIGNCFMGNNSYRITVNPINLLGDINARCSSVFMDGGLSLQNSVNFNDLETLAFYSDYTHMHISSMDLNSHRFGLSNGAHISVSGEINGEMSSKIVTRGAQFRMSELFLWEGARIRSPIFSQYQSQLRGSGIVDRAIIEKSAFLVPGTGGRDCMTTGDLTLKGFFSFYVEELVACNGYSRVNVIGRLDVTGAKFSNISVLGGSGFTKGKRISIFNNDGKDKVIGKFLGLSEGEIFEWSNRSFKITYKGGTGNDVVLTRQ